MLVSVQVLRGFAALMVAIVHLPWLEYQKVHPFPSLGFGYAGVDIFFVISGFIMVLTTQDVAGAHGAGYFLLRRAIRVLPLYWILTCITVIQYSADHGHYRFDPVAWHIVERSFALIPYPYTDDINVFLPLINQGWTLEYEVFFYAIFALSIFLAARHKVMMASSLIFVLCFTGFLVDIPPPLFYFAKTITLEFIFGMAIAQAKIKGFRVNAVWSAVLVSAGLSGIWIVVPHIDEVLDYRGLVWGLPAALVVGGLVLGKPIRANRLTRPFMLLGDMSYSFYLVHDFCYEVWYYAVSGSRATTLITARLYIPMVFSAIVAAYLLYTRLELPMTRKLQTMLLQRRPVVPVAPAPV